MIIQFNPFPNPLCVRFGEGRILMLTFRDADGSGVVLRDTGKPHSVGEEANMPAEKGATPKTGEIYLHFTNIESARALRTTLDETIDEMSSRDLIADAVSEALTRRTMDEHRVRSERGRKGWQTRREAERRSMAMPNAFDEAAAGEDGKE